MQTMTATTTPHRRKTMTAFPAAIGAAVVVGDLASVLIARIAHGAGVTHSFPPLHFATYTALIVLGVIGGAIGWQLVQTRATNPHRLLARLVPLILLLSFVPDILIGITKAEVGTTWGGVLALMAMHIVVAVAAVGSYLHFLPVPRDLPVEDHDRLNG
jgi:H+/Cl- antiporter ClcA